MVRTAAFDIPRQFLQGCLEFRLAWHVVATQQAATDLEEFEMTCEVRIGAQRFERRFER